MQPGKQSGIRRVTSWQLVGAQLRHFRKLAGLTQAALAEQAGVGEDTIASIEQGRRALQSDLAIQLDELLDTKGVLRVAVERIPRKERYQALVKDFVQYEQDAASLLWYESQLVPGLLQTEAYARFIFGCNYPPLEEDEIESGWRTGSTARRSWSVNPGRSFTSSWRRASSTRSWATPTSCGSSFSTCDAAWIYRSSPFRSCPAAPLGTPDSRGR